jgi:hypothetical protein
MSTPISELLEDTVIVKDPIPVLEPRKTNYLKKIPYKEIIILFMSVFSALNIPLESIPRKIFMWGVAPIQSIFAIILFYLLNFLLNNLN